MAWSVARGMDSEQRHVCICDAARQERLARIGMLVGEGTGSVDVRWLGQFRMLWLLLWACG